MQHSRTRLHLWEQIRLRGWRLHAEPASRHVSPVGSRTSFSVVCLQLGAEPVIGAAYTCGSGSASAIGVCTKHHATSTADRGCVSTPTSVATQRAGSRCPPELHGSIQLCDSLLTGNIQADTNPRSTPATGKKASPTQGTHWSFPPSPHTQSADSPAMPQSRNCPCKRCRQITRLAIRVTLRRMRAPHRSRPCIVTLKPRDHMHV